LAPIKKNNKWGFVDKNGKLVIPPLYDRVANFSDGLAAVQVNGELGFIDISNRFVILPQFSDNISYYYYDTINNCFFYNGVVNVMRNDKWGLINKKGNFIVQPQFINVFTIENDLIRVSNDYGEGLIKLKYPIVKSNK
jgi:WG containing repeat